MEFKKKLILVLLLALSVFLGYIGGYYGGVQLVQQNNADYEVACYQTCLTVNKVSDLANAQSDLLTLLSGKEYDKLIEIDCNYLKGRSRN